MEDQQQKEKHTFGDFPVGMMKLNPPPSLRAFEPEQPSPDGDPVGPHVILDRDDFYDSGIFISPSDLSPEIEPRETDTNLVLLDNNSVTQSSQVRLGSKECSLRHIPACLSDTALVRAGKQRPPSQVSTIQDLLNPVTVQADRTNFDSLSAGPPVLDLTKLMMQPVRASPSPPTRKRTVAKKTSVLPDSLLQKVTAAVRDKTKAGLDLLMRKVTSDSQEIRPECQEIEFTEVECCLSLGSDSSEGEGTDQTDCVTAPMKRQEEKTADNIPTKAEDENYLMVIEPLCEEKCPKILEKKAKKGAKRKKRRAPDDVSAKREKKEPPNYFVAVQITNPQIHNGIRIVQNHIKKQKELLTATVVPEPTLHVTLFVTFLEEEADVDRVKKALDECVQKLETSWATDCPPLLTVSGIGDFRNQVIFAKLQKGPELDSLYNIADTVFETLTSCNIASTDSRGFKPHITIMKLSKAPKLRRKGIKKISPELYDAYSSSDFGCQRVLSLQLCSMFKPKDEKGYYHVEHTAKFKLPEDEPGDGSGGVNVEFRPSGDIDKRTDKFIVEFEKELKWTFTPPP